MCATIGRLLDFIEKGYIKLNHLMFLIFEEADKLFTGKFYDDITKLFKDKNLVNFFKFRFYDKCLEQKQAYLHVQWEF